MSNISKETLASNLMMHSSYWRNRYNDALSDLIPQHQKDLIIREVVDLKKVLYEATVRLGRLKYKGGELTLRLGGVEFKLQECENILQSVIDEVNKNHNIINLDIYPID